MPLILTPGYLEAQAAFYEQLGTLQRAGLGLIGALQTVGKNPPRRSVVAMVPAIIAGLQRGQTFSDALGSVPERLPELDRSLLEAGEKTGRLDQVFLTLGRYYSDRARLLRKMLSSFAYPVFVLHFAALIFPTSLLTDLVWKGEVLLFLLSKLAIFIPLYAIGIGLLMLGTGRFGGQWKALFESILNGIPFLGEARRNVALARLAMTMEALLSAGINISEVWVLGSRCSGSPRLIRATAHLPQGIAAGRTPAEMWPAIRAIPTLFCNLYQTGEISGDLDNTLARLHVYYQEQATRQFEAIVDWTPRILYLAVVLYVAWNILSFYAGYFGAINDAMN